MKTVRPILISAAALLLLAGYFLVVRIPSDAVGLAGGGPGEAPRVYGPGFHISLPGSGLVVYSTAPVTASGQTMVTPATGGEIPARFTVTARLDPGRVADLRAAIGGRPLEEFLSAQAGLLLGEYASHAGAVDILTPQFRTRAAEQIAGVFKNGGLAEASIVIRPPDDETLLAAAQFLAPAGEAWKIRQAVDEAMTEPGGTGSWKLQTALGLVNESERRLAECEKNYLDALAIDPLAIPPMTQLVRLYSTVNEWAKLRRVVDAALTADPNSLPHINWAALVLLRQNDVDTAERLLRNGLSIAPGNSVLLMNLGVLYLKKGRVEEAIDPLQKSVEADSTNTQALFNLGSALAALGRFAEAAPYLERAEQSGTLTLPLARTLQIVHEKLGHSPQAASYRDRVREMEAAAQARRKSKGESHDARSTGKSTP
ncbi:MAG TPA: tetratricopeptide repeat protein [Candidatus Polarisedimenticolia bacterium]|jgi:tetratricopeptide (TPR) repeat protein